MSTAITCNLRVVGSLLLAIVFITSAKVMMPLSTPHLVKQRTSLSRLECTKNRLMMVSISLSVRCDVELSGCYLEVRLYSLS